MLFIDLSPFRLRIYSARSGNRTCTPEDVSNPEEIKMPSTMKGDPGLATRLTPVLIVRLDTAPTVPVTESPVPVLRHQCRYLNTSAGICTPVPVMLHQCRYLRHQCHFCYLPRNASVGSEKYVSKTQRPNSESLTGGIKLTNT
jgi:hypothetical protein